MNRYYLDDKCSLYNLVRTWCNWPHYWSTRGSPPAEEQVSGPGSHDLIMFFLSNLVLHARLIFFLIWRGTAQLDLLLHRLFFSIFIYYSCANNDYYYNVYTDVIRWDAVEVSTSAGVWIRYREGVTPAIAARMCSIVCYHLSYPSTAVDNLLCSVTLKCSSHYGRLSSGHP